MAKMTIEDGIDSVANRFRLVMCSAQRGRELASGVEPTVERASLSKHEKNAVIALREITQGNLDVEALEDSIVRNHRRFSPIEDATEEGAEEGAAEGAQLAAASAEILPEVKLKAEDEVKADAVEAAPVEDEAVQAMPVDEATPVEDEAVQAMPVDEATPVEAVEADAVEAEVVQAMPVQAMPVQAMPAGEVGEESSDKEGG